MSFSELRFFLSVLEMPTVVLHVAAGFVALVMAPIAMWTQKGGKQHRRWGKVYFWAMFVIFVTALALVYFRPNFFLLMISFLSFYGAFSGYRALFRKRPGQATWLDWLGAGIALAAGITFVAWGLLGIAGLIDLGIPDVFGFIGIGFGIFLASNGLADLRHFRAPPADRNWWWTYHLIRMNGSYIAAVSAFTVQNVSRMLPDEYAWITWVLPSLIGAPLIARTMRAYRRRFAGVRRPPGNRPMQSQAE